jgi:acyl-CoA dehydrogenase
MTAAKNPDRGAGVEAFDRALFGHIGFTLSNAVRSFIMALTHARFTRAPVQGTTARYYQHVIRFSASFAFAVDVAMLTLGGYLKKKENLSARLGDVLSYMYLASMVLKHHENQGRQEEDLPIVEWACRNLLYQAQEQLHGFLRNFPNRLLAAVMRVISRAGGVPAPGIAWAQGGGLVTAPSEARLRLQRLPHLEPSNALAPQERAAAVELEPLGNARAGRSRPAGHRLDLPGRIQQALALGLISETEAAALRDYDRKVMALIHVDDFDSQALGTQTQPAARSSVHVA